MKIQMNMTQKDKKLLFLVGIILVIWLGVQFVILPAKEKNDTLKENVEQAQTEQMTMEDKITMLSTNQSAVENTTQELRNNTADLYDKMDNSQVDKLITELIVSHGLVARNLSIDVEPNQDGITAYVNSDLALTQLASAATDEAAAAADSTEESTTESAADAALAEGDTTAETTPQLTASPIYTTRVTATIDGDEAGFINLMDAVFNNETSMRVVNYSVDRSTQLVSDAESLTTETLTLTLDIYMFDKNGLNVEG